MYFQTLDALLRMDGHGAFVWSAYGLTFVVVVCLLVAPNRRRRKFLQQLSGELMRSGEIQPPGGR